MTTTYPPRSHENSKRAPRTLARDPLPFEGRDARLPVLAGVDRVVHEAAGAEDLLAARLDDLLALDHERVVVAAVAVVQVHRGSGVGRLLAVPGVVPVDLVGRPVDVDDAIVAT